MAPLRQTHNIYVVELEARVWEEKAKFKNENLHYPGCEGARCFYVGMTGLSPDERFDNHKRGHKANKYVQEYGLYLRRKMFEHANPMSHEDACKREVELAQELRAKGHAVWQK